MREKRKGYPVIVSIGYRTEKNSRGEIKDKKPIRVMNVRDLEKVGENNIAIIGKVGRRKKIEIINAAKGKNIDIANRNIDKVFKDELKKETKTKITAEEAKKIIKENTENRKFSVPQTSEKQEVRVNKKTGEKERWI